ncbi:uncharacterized protein LOC128668633 isoform X2 [Microplitis demolitor]|uniref:uncharacterized protein LOC128668633 isoform X2 n=1 Tax=Microplitis demolitor TaxID=69319 RepID=UPI00235B64C5|nr:uncharacterized protein LOC128668633 isoform X2 [Microplitis demolitor]
MAVMKLNRFCCCCELKIGIQIIGTLGLLAYIFAAIVPFVGNDQLCTDLYYDKCGNLTRGEKTGITLFNLTAVVVIILMIYGSNKNIHALMIPMLVTYGITITWTFISFLLALVQACRKIDNSNEIVILLLEGSFTALFVYFWMKT